MIFLKVTDHTGNPGLVSVDKILFISSQAGYTEESIKCRIHMVGDTNQYVDIRNSFDDVISRLLELLER